MIAMCHVPSAFYKKEDGFLYLLTIQFIAKPYKSLPKLDFIATFAGGKKENLFHLQKFYNRKIINQVKIYHFSHLYTFQNHVESFASFGVDSG